MSGSRGQEPGEGRIGRLKAHQRAGGRPLAVLALILAMVLWGSVFVGTEQLLEDTGAFTLATGRFAIGLAVLLPLAYRQGFRARFVLNKTYLLLGLTGVFLSYGLQNFALEYTSASSAALIMAGMPAAIALMGVLFLRERLPSLRLAGIAVSIAGVILVSGVASGGGAGMLLGNALMVGSVLAYGVYAAQGRALLVGSHPAAVVTAASFGAGLLLLLPPALGEVYLSGMPEMGLRDLSLLLYLGIGTTAATIFLWNFALRFIDAGGAGIYFNLVPVSGLMFAIMVGESVTPVQLAGGALAIAGVLLGDHVLRGRRLGTQQPSEG